ncbi:hypothetical protein ACHWQZ_G017484 [Mnemiopsis leidyi]
MNLTLLALALATLFLPTDSIRCYRCHEVSYTIAGKKTEIPDEVKCDKNSTYACETNVTACFEVRYDLGMTITDVPGTAEGILRGCDSTQDMAGVCDSAETALKESFKNQSIEVDDFDCSAKSCSYRDYCNAGHRIELSFLMAIALAAIQLFTQLD